MTFPMTGISSVTIEPTTPKKTDYDSTWSFERVLQQDLERYMLNSLWIKPNKITIPKIKNVIFNNPYTIVFWQDGTKTIVTCGEGDVWDEEKGVALAFVKKLYGNKGSYIDNIKPHLTENVEKEKAKAAEEKKKFEAEAQELEEKRRQRYIKNLAKKRLREERLEKEIKEAVRKIKPQEKRFSF